MKWSWCAARNMGDIFRKNALNLGLHVVQSPDAVADARDGDEFSFATASRVLTNETQQKIYEPLPLTAKEDEMRRMGRHLYGRAAGIQGSDPDEPDHRVARSGSRAAHDVHGADRLGASRGQDRRGQARSNAARLCRSAARIRWDGAVRHSHVQHDYRRRDDLPAPGCHRQRSFRLHRQGRRRQADGDWPRLRRAPRHRRSRTTRRPATASFISIFRSRVLSCRGSSSRVPTRTAAPTGRTARSASEWVRPPSASDGPPAMCMSRSPPRAGSC